MNRSLPRPTHAVARGLTIALLASAAAPCAIAAPATPRLVVQITVDGLRGDLPQRFAPGYGEGGWRRFLDDGLHYTHAHYAHANTETIVGHASLATGAYPADHGMVANVWLDRAAGELTYNIEDPRHTLLVRGAGVDKKTEIDPTQRVARSEGRSPAAIRVSTLADELAIATAGRGKRFAVSVKDRGAVPMAGHGGKAFWFSKAAGEFVTSSYYYDELPAWVDAFNAARHPQRYAGTAWALSGDPASYLFGDADDAGWETALPGWGRTFPHAYGAGDGKGFTTFLTLSPAGDELTLDFAKALVENEMLGRDDVPDYLAISFSSTDYVNHVFGPSSLEAEDNQRRLDRTLAALLAFLDRAVGLEHTLIVLSADHGTPEVPAQLAALGLPGATFEPDTLESAPGLAALKARLGIDGAVVQSYFHPYLYLDRALIAERGLDRADVQQAVATAIEALPGVRHAVPASRIVRGDLPDTAHMRAVRASFDPVRSGDIHLVFEAQTFIADFDGLSVAASHGSPWGYDTHVPIIFLGAGIAAGRVARPVAPYDIAPTLAARLGVSAPSAVAGAPLPEVLAPVRP